MRSHHDMGGLPAGSVERKEHDYALWEKRVDALMVLLAAPQRRLLRVDELRRNIEALPPDAYERMSYYERWIIGDRQHAAAARRLHRRRARPQDGRGRGAAGHAVSERRALARAFRTRRRGSRSAAPSRPDICARRGTSAARSARSSALCGAFANPEELAYNRPGMPEQPLYRVRFRQRELWPDYRGAAHDTIEIEIYQHWLEPARADDRRRYRSAPA